MACDCQLRGDREGMKPLNHGSVVPHNPACSRHSRCPNHRKVHHSRITTTAAADSGRTIRMLYHSPFTDQTEKLVYLAYLNAGLRIHDIDDPSNLQEIGYFMPPDPTQRFGPQPPDALVLQTEDVLVDRRGYVYLSNKNQGLWVLRYTGPKKP